MRPGAFGLLAFVAAIGHERASAQDLPMAGRFEAELKALAAHDHHVPREAVGTLFIGSSSIRLWNVKADFAAHRPLNHGFGGATVLDVLANYDLLTTRYEPETIIVYVGENDIVHGRGAQAAADDVIMLLSRLRGDFPVARILYLSMKASPARWSRRAAFEQANREIRARSESGGGFDFIDVAASLLLPGDAPDPDCFGEDGIHLSMIGYQRWRKIISDYLTGEAGASQAALASRPLPPAGVKSVATGPAALISDPH